jgi:hypothetical protein
MAAPRFDSATVVLGMHRSGTSALAGALRLCGLAAPKTVVAASETNRRGFWESATIKAFDDEVLGKLGRTWHSLVPIHFESLGTRELGQIRKRASTLLAGEFDTGTHILLKEPRICRLLPMWEPVLREAANHLAYPIIIRNPVEVAKSLVERNEFDLNHGLLLWARYTLDAEFHTRGKRRAFVSYAKLLGDVRSAVAGLAESLDLPIDFDQADVSAIEEYLAPDLRHHRESDKEALVGKPETIAETYRILSGWSEGRSETEADYEKLDTLRDQLDHLTVAIADIFETARRDHKRWVDARAQVERSTSDLLRLQRSFEQFQDAKEALGIVDSLRAELAAVAQRAEEQALQVSQLSASLQERRKLEDALEQAIRANADTASRLDRALADAAEAAEQFARQKALLEAEHQRTREELRGQNESLNEAKERLEAVDAELQRTKRKYRAAQWDVERERRAHQASRSQLAAAEATVARYQRSVLWRAYTKAAGAAARISARASGRAPSTRKRRAEQIQSIASSGLFDRDWYLATYPDVAAASADPLVHFCELGWREGRDPGPGFATSAYLKGNPDVARTGINPLFHYIEFGRSEGREIRAHRAPGEAPATQVHDFPEPAPVFRGENPPERAVAWDRSYRLEESDDRLVMAGELMVGYAKTAHDRIATEAAFERLAILSGLSALSARAATGAEYGSAALIDAWYTNRTELRTRWRDDRWPFVVRAYQHDPVDNGRLALVGEGLLASELDLVDFTLKNPYFPVLIIFGDADGVLLGARLMSFPSLCRGGLHYPELLAGYPNAPDPLEGGRVEADRLLSARSGSDRLVDTIILDTTGGDGTSPLFDPAFQKWLEDVARIRVNASPPVETGEAEARSGSLALASDMIPTIRILGEREGTGDAASHPVFLPLLIAGEERSQPATLLELPRGASLRLGVGALGYPAPWPRFNPAGRGRVPMSSDPAAIRLPNGRELSDSDLLVPCPGSALGERNENSAGLTWLISAGDWQPAQLVQAIRALSLQSGAISHVIGFVGQVDPLCQAVAQEFFGDRVGYFEALAAAAEGIETPLVGHVGPGVILHDPRSVSVLEALLSDQAIASAACVLVTTEKRGKGWHASIVDGGTISLDLSDGRTVAGEYSDSALPWRASIPVSRPPRDLWVARASSVKSWIRSGAPEPLRKGMHVSTSLVTASYLGERADHVPEVPLPSATAGRSTKARALFG